MLRIVLFLITNLAVMLLLGIIVKLFGVETYLAGQGVGMNLNGLLIMAGVFGMGGSIISLLISKWTAKRMMGLQVIEQPRDGAETWLLDTVTRQASAAPRDAFHPNCFHALVPPSTLRQAPVTLAASGLARKATSAATSSALP